MERLTHRRARTLLDSFNFAVEGIIHVFRTQRNMRIHMLAAVWRNTSCGHSASHTLSRSRRWNLRRVDFGNGRRAPNA